MAGAGDRSGRSLPAVVTLCPQTGPQLDILSADRGESGPVVTYWSLMGSDFDKVARIAGSQHGRITWAQILQAGIGAKQAAGWRRNGLLRRKHRGVYAVGHDARSLLADLKAAELAAGEGAAISHGSAGCLLRLIPRPPRQPEVTVPVLNGRRRPGIIMHRVRALPRADTFVDRGIRVTIVPRTLLDLAPRLTLKELTAACHEAWVHHATTPRRIEACIARNPHKPGIAKLLRALGSDVTLSALEDGFLDLLARHRLPAPRTNIDHRGDKVDCHWPDLVVTIELLGYRFHNSRKAFENDIGRRRRSGHFAFTWGDVFEREAATAREVAALLSSA